MPKFKKGNKHSDNPTPYKNTNSKKGNDRNAQHDRKSYGKCGYLHGGECMVGINACYGCCKSKHMIRDFPHVKNQARVDTQPRPNPTSAADPPKRNIFYALKSRK